MFPFQMGDVQIVYLHWAGLMIYLPSKITNAKKMKQLDVTELLQMNASYAQRNYRNKTSFNFWGACMTGR